MGTVLSLLLLAVTVGALLLQLRTIRRAGTAGLAPSTWFGLVASSLVWLGYGVATGDATVVAVNVVVLLVGLRLVVAILHAAAVPPTRFTVHLVVPALAWAGAWAGDAPWLLGVVGTAIVVGRLVPQVVQAVRAADRSGISAGSWLGNAGVNVVWALYGTEIGDVLVWLPSVVSVTLSLVIAALVLGGGSVPPLPRRQPRRATA